MFASAANASEIPMTAGRTEATNPIGILDAPGLQESFRLNLMDRGSCNVLSVALGDTTYL